MLATNAFLSFATYTNNSDFNAVFNQDFYNMNCASNINQTNCNIQGNNHTDLLEAFIQPNYSPATPVLYSALAKKTGPYIFPKSLALLSITTNNNVIPLTSSVNFYQSPLFTTTLREADVNLSQNNNK